MGTFTEKVYDLDCYLQEIGLKDTIENPKVSIIVPTYNNDEYLEKCLFSLLKQTLKDIEIIVVNDGSTDTTKTILSLFEKYDTRVKIIHQENRKQGAARNVGTNIAEGEYIGFVDSDDWVDLTYYEKLYEAAKKYNSDIALATNVRVGGNKKTKKRLNITEEQFVTSLQDKIDIGNQAKNPCPTNKIYRRTMLEENGIDWEEGVYCEDKLFTIQAIYHANGVVSVPNINYYYFRNPHSTVNTKSREHFFKLNKDKNNARLAVLNFLKSKNVQIRDCEFWAVTDEKRFLNIPIYTKKESLHTIEHRLFSFILLKKEVV